MKINPISNNYNILFRHAKRPLKHEFSASFKRSEKVTADDRDLTLGTIVNAALGTFCFVFLAIYGSKKLSKIYSQIAGK